jgi:hypothetical protein
MGKEERHEVRIRLINRGKKREDEKRGEEKEIEG